MYRVSRMYRGRASRDRGRYRKRVAIFDPRFLKWPLKIRMLHSRENGALAGRRRACGDARGEGTARRGGRERDIMK